MISCVSDIMIKAAYTVDACDGVCKAIRLMDEEDIRCLPVMENGKLLGILTARDIGRTHPNRIVADAMSKKVSVPSNTSLWKAKQVFEETRIEVLMIEDEDNFEGMITEASLYEELGKHTDYLTGLYRSEYIYHAGTELWNKGAEISVIFIDLNNFGQIDKEFGHILGDIVLKETGKLLKSYSNEDTFLCRFGGDEYVVLTQYEQDRCRVFAQSLLKAISSHKYVNDIHVTASVGIAGGRRGTARTGNPVEMVMELINLASLASTKAKTEESGIALAEGCFPGDTINGCK